MMSARRSGGGGSENSIRLLRVTFIVLSMESQELQKITGKLQKVDITEDALDGGVMYTTRPCRSHGTLQLKEFG